MKNQKKVVLNKYYKLRNQIVKQMQLVVILVFVIRIIIIMLVKYFTFVVKVVLILNHENFLKLLLLFSTLSIQKHYDDWISS